ncbi:MAG: MotA/TolQ/ExbB proton channel family protein [Planctomycetota bacterium]
MSWLTDWMSRLAEITLPSILVLLTIMAAATVVLIGGIVREWCGRRRVDRSLADALAQAAPDGTERLRLQLLRGHGLPTRFASGLGQHGDVDAALLAARARASATLAPLTFLTRIGPMCGLIATLLPLGPALEALAGGELEDAATELTVAFTATVIGLLVSVAAYLIGLVRRTWYVRDYDRLEDLAHRLRPHPPEATA